MTTDMIDKLEAKQTTLAEAIAAIDWICECLNDDVTAKDHFRWCHQCGQWLHEGVFFALPPIECRPICFNCRSINEQQSPA